MDAATDFALGRPIDEDATFWKRALMGRRRRRSLFGRFPRRPFITGSRSRSRLCPGEELSLLRACREKRGASQDADIFIFFRSHRVMLNSWLTESKTFVRYPGISILRDKLSPGLFTKRLASCASVRFACSVGTRKKFRIFLPRRMKISEGTGKCPNPSKEEVKCKS